MKGLCIKIFLKGLMEYLCIFNLYIFFGVRMILVEVDMFNIWISIGILFMVNICFFKKGYLFFNKFLL